MANPNSTFDQFLASAGYKYLTDGNFVDNIFQSPTLLGLLKANNAYQECDGGNQIVVPIEYSTNPSVKAIGAYDSVVIGETSEFTAANFPWGSYGGSLALARLDMIKNSGEAQKIKLLKSKIKNLEKSIRSVINQALFTGNAAQALNILGLDQLIEATGTVGGIDSSVNTWWQSTTATGSAVLSDSAMGSAYLSASNNIAPPHVGLTTQTLYQKYSDLAVSKVNLMVPNAKVADLGFDQLAYKGKPVVYDAQAASGDFFWLNFDYLTLQYSPDGNFAVTKPEEVQEQFVLFQKIFWAGQLCISDRRMCSRLRSRTAS